MPMPSLIFPPSLSWHHGPALEQALGRLPTKSLVGKQSIKTYRPDESRPQHVASSQALGNLVNGLLESLLLRPQRARRLAYLQEGEPPRLGSCSRRSIRRRVPDRRRVRAFLDGGRH